MAFVSGIGVTFLGNLASDPSPGKNGEIYYNTTSNTLRAYENGAWGALGGGGANTALSNLTSPTAANQDLLPGTDNSFRLGNTTDQWSEVHSYSYWVNGPLKLASNVSGELVLWDGSSSRGSVGLVSRTLIDFSQTQSADWQDRWLFDTSNIKSVDWANRLLEDSSAAGSVDWQNRVLADSSVVLSLNWQTRQLMQNNSTPYLDWSGGVGVAPNSLVAFTDLIFNTGGSKIKSPDGSAGSAPLTITTGDNTTFSAITGQLNLNTGNLTGLNGGTGDISLITGHCLIGGNGNSGNVIISSGNSGTNAGNSGNVTLAIGTNAGVAGKIRFQDGSQGTAGSTWMSTDVNGSGAWRNLGYFNGYVANSNNWGTTGVTTSFATFSNQGGTPTLNTRYNNGISPSASSDAGLTFTPPSTTAAYEFTVNVMPLVYTSPTDSVGFQLTDGTTVFAQMGYTTSSNGGANPTQNATLTGIYVPGTTSSVTVHIQVITSANSPVALVGYVGGQAAAAQIEWQIRQIAY